MAYVKSKDIQLFPSAFRGQYETTGTGTVFNPGSRLTTEYNLTTLSSRTSKYHHSYVLQYDKGTNDKTIVFSLKGYLFEIKMASYLLEPPFSDATTTNIWAKIKLVDIASDEGFSPNTVDTKPVLVPLSGGNHILDDILDDDTTEERFLGLSLEITDPTLENEEYKSLLILEKVNKVNNVWDVPSKSYFRLRTDEISDKTSTNKSIDKVFNTEDLTATKINNVTIATTGTSGTLTITDGKELKVQGNVTLAGTGTATLDKNLIVRGDKNVTIDTTGANANKILKVKGNVTLAGTGTATLNKDLTVNNNNFILDADAERTLKISGANKEIAGAGSVLTLGGNLTTSGAHATTLTTTAATALTLPTTGTLATIENIQALDAVGATNTANKTIRGWSETDGIVSISTQDIAIESSKITDKTNSYNSSSEAVVTGKAVNEALKTLDVTETSNTADKTISAWSEVDGKVSISTQDISITSSQISDKTNSYSGTDTVAITGKGVKAALDTLDVSGTSSFGADNTISAWSEKDGKVSITSQPISISTSQVTGFDTHTHSYAASSSVGGSATTVTTTLDTSNTLNLTGVVGKSTTLKRTTSITAQGGALYATTFNASSDRRLKENIVDYKYHDSILDIAVKEFDYKNTSVHTIGFVAQELQEKFPEIVTSGENGYLSIAENKLVYLLLEEVKQLKEEVEQLKRGG